jgi:hypothetical protein
MQAQAAIRFGADQCVAYLYTTNALIIDMHPVGILPASDT